MTDQALATLEAHRLVLQAELDATKSRTERNRLGQFATPTQLATSILERAKLMVPAGRPIRFLDPALGTGAFYAALLRVFDDERIETARGYEIDEQYGSAARSLWVYLQTGRAQGIHERYLCRQRSPWYAQDKRDPSPFLCTYMGRQSNGATPFRFILNHSQAIAPNVYLNMYPKGPLAQLLHEKPELKVTIWHSLQAISAERLIGEGRVYGGGLYKLEPRELGNLLLADIFEGLDEVLAAFPRQPRLF